MFDHRQGRVTVFSWSSEEKNLDEKEIENQREERRVRKRALAIGLHGISVENRLIEVVDVRAASGREG